MTRRTILIGSLISLLALGSAWSAFHYIPRAFAEQENEHESGERDYGDDYTAPTYVVPSVVTTPTTTITPTTPAPSGEATVTPTTTPVTTTAVDTAAPTLTTPVLSEAFPWPWLIARALGIVSFVLLGLLSVTGMLLTTGALYRIMSPATAWSTHRAIGSVLLFSVLGHLTGLLFDRFINLRLVDVLVPFASQYQTTLVALGTIGFYLMLLVLAATLYTMNRWKRFWRTVHFFAFPMYIIIFFHGVLLGTDTKHWWMQVVYWGSGAVVGLAILYRMAWKYRQSKPEVALH